MSGKEHQYEQESDQEGQDVTVHHFLVRMQPEVQLHNKVSHQ